MISILQLWELDDIDIDPAQYQNESGLPLLLVLYCEMLQKVWSNEQKAATISISNQWSASRIQALLDRNAVLDRVLLSVCIYLRVQIQIKIMIMLVSCLISDWFPILISDWNTPVYDKNMHCHKPLYCTHGCMFNVWLLLKDESPSLISNFFPASHSFSFKFTLYLARSFNHQLWPASLSFLKKNIPTAWYHRHHISQWWRCA